MQSSFVRRRSDFHGLTMKGVFVPQDGFMDIIENYEEKIPYMQETKTYIANGFTYGIFNDILQRLEKQHNFSCQLYIQNPRKWGKVVFHDNGSVDANGMLGEVFLGRADIAATSITITKSRLRYLDFLPPMATEVITIVVPTNAVIESLDYWLFASPLHIHLWITILIAIIIMAVMKTVMVDGLNCFKVNEHIWTISKAFFGGGQMKSCKSKASIKILVLTSLLCGYIIWASYNAFLTAELIVMDKQYPFVDLKSLSSTNWKYACSSKHQS